MWLVGTTIAENIMYINNRKNVLDKTGIRLSSYKYLENGMHWDIRNEKITDRRKESNFWSYV